MPIDQLSERHYTPQELAALWRVSDDVIRRMFEREEGVFMIDRPETRTKRRHVTMRIPQSAATRVYARHTRR
jgi:hypothetical protein